MAFALMCVWLEEEWARGKRKKGGKLQLSCVDTSNSSIIGNKRLQSAGNWQEIDKAYE